MDAALTDELRALRARAYGRDADLDPAAAERLRELEAMRTTPARESEVDEFAPRNTDADDAAARTALFDALEQLDESGGAFDRPDASGAVQTTDDDALRGKNPDDSAPDRATSTQGLGRRHRVAWIASLVAAAALASIATWGIAEITPVATSSGAPQVATLKPVAESGVVGSMFAADGDSPMFDFFGLSLFRGAGAGWSGSSGDAGTCLHVLATEHVPDVSEIESGSWGVDGPIYTGCGAGAFPAAVTLAIDASAPALLRDEFPDATAIQFVLDGDRVGVFLDEG